MESNIFNNNDIDDSITDDEEFLELINIIELPRRPRMYKQRPEYFEDASDEEFLDRFRLPKEVVRMVINLIAADIASPTAWNHAISVENMVLITLRFFATGSMLVVVGDFMGIHKSTASRVVRKVSRALASLRPAFVKMPNTEEEFRNTMTQFYEIARFPRCIGALDCTHIKIQSPGGADAEIYRNRKSFFSLNVQAICDANLLIRNIVCRWPGSCHDSTIFNNSNLRVRFERGDFAEGLLVGDSGYAVKPYLITPLLNPVTPAEHLFNESQIRTRNLIERCFGCLKRRFPILAYGMRVKLDRVEAIVVAAVVLHNIARDLHLPDPPINEDVEAAIDFMANINENVVVNPERNAIWNLNNATRYAIIQQHFVRILQ